MTPDVPPPVDRYTHGHDASVVNQHARRTAEEAAAFLLPHLRPGQRLLDVGCGPGSITVGLARAVAPGEVVGIDTEPAVLEDARARAAAEGVANVRFEEASVYALPYADASFDAAYAHQVLQHLTRPVEALREMRRVVRPGGLVGVRDSDYGTMVHWPPQPALERWLALYHAVTARNHAEADAGRRIPAWMRAAGFAPITITGTTWPIWGPEAVANWGLSWAARVETSALGRQAVEYGLATPDDLAAIAAGWRAWTREPDAFFAFLHIEALGTVPAGRDR